MSLVELMKKHDYISYISLRYRNIIIVVVLQLRRRGIPLKVGTIIVVFAVAYALREFLAAILIEFREARSWNEIWLHLLTMPSLVFGGLLFLALVFVMGITSS